MSCLEAVAPCGEPGGRRAEAPGHGAALARARLWHELGTGVRRSLERGTLCHGAEVLERLGHHIDDETAQAVLRASGRR
ncbi:hypothetical protein ACWEN3_10105 [Streptomyces sp. NPDC004561]